MRAMPRCHAVATILWNLNADRPPSPSRLNGGPAYFRCRRRHPVADLSEQFMADLLWLAVLVGLFLLTLAFVRLCDAA